MMHQFSTYRNRSLIKAVMGIALLHLPLNAAAEMVTLDDPITFLSSSPNKKERELKDEKEREHNTPSVDDRSANKDNYTINFNNVSIIEFIRFVSKITNLNFIFDDTELNFNVTIVSEDPVTPRNIMSILVQVLRIHNLTVLEQENNLLITGSKTVSQIATIVSSDLPDGHQGNIPVVTRVFRIKNANLGTISTVVRPMLSQAALLEVSAETRQLIITDITTNVDKVSALLTSLDAPHSPLEVDSYTTQNADLVELISLATQLTAPFKEGNPLILVPHEASRTVFIVSTPYLIEKTLAILEDLDVSPGSRSPLKNIYIYKLQYLSGSEFLLASKKLSTDLQERGAPQSLTDAFRNAKWIETSNSVLFTGDEPTLSKIKELLPTLDTIAVEEQLKKYSNFFVYKLQSTTEAQFETSLQQMANNLAKAPSPDRQLIEAIRSMQYLKETNSFIFTGDAASLAKIKELLPTLDSVPIEEQAKKNSTFLVYKLQNATESQFEISLRQIADNLTKAPTPDQHLIEAIRSMQYLKETNSFVFTGDEASIARLETLLPTFDSAQSFAASQFVIYKPKYVSQEQLMQALEQLSESLTSESPSDTSLKNAIASGKWMAESSSFVFRGDPATITRLKELLTSIDNIESMTGGEAHTFYLYKLQAASGEVVLNNLKKVAQNLKDSKVPNQPLIHAISETRWIKDNNSILITGSTGSIEQVKKLIEQFDISGPVTPPPASASKSAFYIYKPMYQTPLRLKGYLDDISKDLASSGLIDPDLLLTLQTLKIVDSTASILFTGSPEALEKVKELLGRFDVISPEEVQIQQLGHMTFLIYKIQYVPAQQLITAVKALATDLQKTGAVDQKVIETVNGMKWIKETNSILFVGSNDSLQKVEGMLKKFDVASLAEGPPPPSSTFFVYTPKYQPGDELIQILEDFEQNLIKACVTDKGLFDAINNLKWIEKTCSLLISGDPDSIQKVEDLLRRFDTPSKETAAIPSIESIENTSFLIYKLQYHHGNEILSALKQVSTDIAKGSSSASQNLLNAINSLQWIRVTNSLLASGEQNTLSKLKDLIQNLDIPLRQVFIEILVVETSLTNTNNFGLQWGGKMQYLNKFAAGSGNFPLNSPNSSSASTNGTSLGNGIANGINAATATVAPATTNIPFMTGFDLGVIGDIVMHKGRSFISLGSLVNALQTDTDSTVVMNPKIITQDNRNSTIFIGNNIPFVGSLVTTSAQNVQSSQNLEYRDIGFNLSITPTIGNNDIVTLDINNDISEVLTVPVQGTQNQGGTITGIQSSHTTMSTRVHVPNEHFVVLSGMIQDARSRYRSAIPCLGGLPVIGAAFSENDRVRSQQNIIIFVRPHIINTYEEYKTISTEQEDLFKESANLPILKEEFDAGVDLVKTPGNE